MTSTVNTLPGTSSRVAIVSEYSTCSPGLIRRVPTCSAKARFSDQRVTIRPVESWSRISIRCSLGKLSSDRAIAAIGQGDVNRQLADLRELDRFRRELHREDEAAQFRVLILRDLFRRTKGMSETAEPAPLLLGRRAADASEQNQRGENKR